MLCCKKGDVVLLLIREPPLYLKYLLTGDDPIYYNFCKNIYVYNCAFTFTSISYKKDTQINFLGGIQCFQIHGQLFHY